MSPSQVTEKLYNWASQLDEKTLAQAEMTSRLPFIYPHMALMPDAHYGLGASIGSVIPTLGAVIPAAVGVDIGCGMVAVETGYSMTDITELDLRQFREMVEAAVPASAGGSNKWLTPSAAQRINTLEELAASGGWDPDEYGMRDWRSQLGSLGGGNHFIEGCQDERGIVWLFLHSGSRGIGNMIAQKHIKIAQELCERWWIQLEHIKLAYLVQGTAEFDQYMTELGWAQRFAAENRAEMMERVMGVFASWTGLPLDVDGVTTIQCHHNYTAREMIDDQEVIVSRKGAINAHEGVLGLIPGSMGTKSYVVEGKGNQLAINSAPHGAGRAMSRSKAREQFTQDHLRAQMGSIEYRDSASLIDEIPSAYKDIDAVMSDADDLVTVRHTLSQFVNVKGN